MKTTLLSTITLNVAASLLSASAGAQVFDAPGPGYREQAERFSAKKSTVDRDFVIGTSMMIQRIRTVVDLTTVPGNYTFGTSATFSEPIRLFDANASRTSVLPVRPIEGQK